MQMVLRIFGVAALLVGGLWMLQGLGVVRWPASSFMLDQTPWALRGAALAAGGLALLAVARRRG